MSRTRGVVAAGHPATVQAAAEILMDGGNAFDAAVAAHFTACVAEPVLCSLAGGGFLVAQPGSEKPRVYDFFVQTPRQRGANNEIDFRPILADFGTVQQEFHIGLGATATPGSVKGLFRIHRDLCSLPLSRLVEPAIEIARSGLLLNEFQAYIFSIVAPIYLDTLQARNIFANPEDDERILGAGQCLFQNDQANFLDVLAREGEDLFYRGEVAQAIGQLCSQGGGHLQRSDLENYQVYQRQPLTTVYRNANVYINPPPSSGGLLVAFALDLMSQTRIDDFKFGSANHLLLLTEVMRLTHEARLDSLATNSENPSSADMLHPEFAKHYRQQVIGRAKSYRGTTHISVIDENNNVASLTVSNGEGNGTIVPGTGIMLNNMLGEDDINPYGFHKWPHNQRMTSMMAPAIVADKNGYRVAIGSGGSKRIRSAVLQVLLNLIDFHMPVEQAVNASRLHLEGTHLSIEDGFAESELKKLLTGYGDHTVWSSQNLFFGGAHTVSNDNGSLHGAGDLRRGGTVQVIN